LSERAVSLLYDALHAFEAPFRKGAAYPVHKRLHFRESEISDIYDWICAHVELPHGGNVLDAGCGVGFGAIRLAQRSTCRISGISLSEKEVARASSAAQQASVADRVAFRRSSYDSVPRASYDLIVAVESLKHSPDLRQSLHALRQSLRIGGQLVIVEDLYTGAGTHVAARKVVADWSLRRLYTESDYLAWLGADDCLIFDLTDCAPTASPTALGVWLGVLALVTPFATRKLTPALHAFRGGLNLQRLYVDGAMKYKAIVWRRSKADL
jgi:SAM-dependent methyltransferase